MQQRGDETREIALFRHDVHALETWGKNQHIPQADMQRTREVDTAPLQPGQESRNTCLRIHGGACIALLAFIGHLSKASPPTEALMNTLPMEMRWFAIGVFLAALALSTTSTSASPDLRCEGAPPR